MFATKLMCSWIGAFGLTAGAFGQTYVQLSIAIVGHNTFTSPAGINARGEIAGTYVDQFGYRGFLRDPSGTITPFDVYGVPDGTKAYSINDEGSITGTFTGFPDAYVRDPGGNFTTFAPPGSLQTFPQSINTAGIIAGYYRDAYDVYHGFVRRVNGELISFDPPGSTETTASSINANGAITGFYADAYLGGHGFVRQLSGEIGSFDVPNSARTVPASINQTGAITGSYSALDGRIFGFLRDPQGNFTSFDPGVFTYPTSINDEGWVTGYYLTGSYTSGTGTVSITGQHGFVRSPDGTITSFDPPFCVTSQSSIIPAGINQQGVITGSCLEIPSTSGGQVGWVRYP
jgi:hypothetical protein